MVQPFGSFLWAVTDDGERFLAMETIAEEEAPSLSVVVNWLDAVGGS
jgi:hypothetical protein